MEKQATELDQLFMNNLLRGSQSNLSIHCHSQLGMFLKPPSCHHGESTLTATQIQGQEFGTK